MKIVPSILAEKPEDFLLWIRQAESFTDYVQIDLMDGVFVPSKSFPPGEINLLETALSFELHLMCEDPASLMKLIDNRRLKKVIYHIEAVVDHLAFINGMKRRGLEVGLAVKPETGIGKFKDIVEYVDTLLFMTVDPGRYGSPFKPEVLVKVAESKKLFPGVTISVDGGISLDNLHFLIDAGVDYACVGSRIFLAGMPGNNYRLFLNRLHELEG
jgi:ribulose-phosphate 3-epimerase